MGKEWCRLGVQLRLCRRSSLEYLPNKKDVSAGWYVEIVREEFWLTWTKICDTTTNKPTLFCHAALFSQSDHEETGNLVPSGKEVPAGVEAKSV